MAVFDFPLDTPSRRQLSRIVLRAGDTDPFVRDLETDPDPWGHDPVPMPVPTPPPQSPNFPGFLSWDDPGFIGPPPPPIPTPTATPTGQFYPDQVTPAAPSFLHSIQPDIPGGTTRTDTQQAYIGDQPDPQQPFQDFFMKPLDVQQIESDLPLYRKKLDRLRLDRDQLQGFSQFPMNQGGYLDETLAYPLDIRQRRVEDYETRESRKIQNYRDLEERLNFQQGVIPAGSLAEQQLELYGSPFTYLAGLVMDSLGSTKETLKHPKSLLDVSNMLSTFTDKEKIPFSQFIDVVQRQQSRSNKTRLISEALIDPTVGGLFLGAGRGLGKAGLGLSKEIGSMLPKVPIAHASTGAWRRPFNYNARQLADLDKIEKSMAINEKKLDDLVRVVGEDPNSAPVQQVLNRMRQLGQQKADIIKEAEPSISKLLTGATYNNPGIVHDVGMFNRMSTLEEFGLEPVAASNQYLEALPGMADQISGVVTSNSNIIKTIIARMGINPSIARNTPIGRIATAYHRQEVAAEESINTALSALIDSRMQRWTGRMGRGVNPLKQENQLLPIDQQGLWTEGHPGSPLAEKTGVPWQAVFENPGKYGYGDPQNLPDGIMRDRAMLIEDYNYVINVEARRIMDDVGLDFNYHSANRYETGWKVGEKTPNPYYVPRQVTTIRDIQLTRHSTPALQRHYEDITEGFESGIRYDTDPRRSMELYLRWVYRKSMRKQLDDALEPYSMTPEQLIPAEIRDAYQTSMKTRRAAEILRRRIRSAIVRAEAHTRTRMVSMRDRVKSLEETEGDMDRIDDLLAQLDVLPYERETIPKIQTRTVKGEKLYTGKVKRRGKGQVIRQAIKPEASRRQQVRILAKAGLAKTNYKRLLARKGGKQRLVATSERRLQEMQDRLEILRYHLSAADELLQIRRTEHISARNTYRSKLREFNKSKETTALWGPNQTEDRIEKHDWFNRFMSPEDVRVLNESFRKQDIDTFSYKAYHALEILGNSIRYLSAVGDFAMPFIQGLPVLATDPEAWGRMTARHYQAFFDPSVQARLVKTHIEYYRWLARNGVPIGDPEFFAALNRGGGISLDKVYKKLGREDVQRFTQTVGRQRFGRFQASYNTGLGYSRVLLYRGLKSGWKGTDSELAQYIRNLTGGLDSRALGVGPAQRAVEGMFLAFSPRLLRSTVALVGDALLRPDTVVGRASFRSLGQLSMGAVSTFVITGKALGKTDEEIQAGLNPLNGKRFLAHQINGDWIGMGGQVRAIAQLLTGIGAGIYGGTARLTGLPFPGAEEDWADPSKLITRDPYDNPLISMYLSRGAVGVNLVGGVMEAAPGMPDILPYDEIDGPIELVNHVGKSAIPFAIQSVLEGQQPLSVALGGIGMRTSPETKYEKQDRARKTVMQELGVATTDNSGEYKDISRISDKDAVNTDPRVIAAGEEVAKLNRERKSVVQTFKDDMNKTMAIHDDLIAQSADQLGAGKAFRENLPNLMQDKAQARINVENKQRHADAMSVFDDLEPNAALEFKILREYMATVQGARLENPATGAYDFDRRQGIEDKFREEYGDRVMDSIQEAIRADEHPLVKELREDRETLHTYWEANKRVKKFFPDGYGKKWDEFLALTDDRRKRNMRRDSHVIRRMEKAVDAIREGMVQDSKENDPFEDQIDVLLLKWGYASAPKTRSGIRVPLPQVPGDPAIFPQPAMFR